jgi:hypothetical protein
MECLLLFGAESSFPFLFKNVRAMYRTLTLPYVLCGHETWFVTNKEDRLRINPNSEVIRVLYSPRDTIRVIKSRIMRWAGHVTRMGERRGALVRQTSRREISGKT